MEPEDSMSPPRPALSAREWAYASWSEGDREAVTVSLGALQKLLDELNHLRALAFAVENRLKVTIESAGSDDPEKR
jgi:hypothetical protein